MKIALITETYAPEINGVSMTLGRLVRGLQAEGCDVEVIVPRRPDRDLTKADVALIQVPGLPIPGYDQLRFGLPASRKLKAHWRLQRPDVVHVATEGPLGWSAARAANVLGIPLVTSYHTHFDSYSGHYRAGFLRRFIANWMKSVHDRGLVTWVPSEDVRQNLLSRNYRDVRVLGRGVDTDLYGPHRRDRALRTVWGCGETTPVALYVGRLAGEKNLPLSIQAYHAMRATLPELRMVIVGDGPMRTELSAQHPEIIFTGMKSGIELAACYASAEIFLFASTTETFGNVVTEAMASGLVVMAYNYAAPGKYIQNGVSGFLAPYNESDAYLRMVEEATQRRCDWKIIGEAARAAVKDLSWESIVRSYLEQIKRLS
ncbi:MAG: glycosyltransferase family 1 protein [Verrucomicrobia bacterium]|nr:glycosyltransferase family 1 protein [Verrucomicrobiota bacterium]